MIPALLIVSVDVLGESASSTPSQIIPPSPPRPTTFLAPPDDQAGRVARIIAKRFSSVMNMRAQTKGQWLVDPAAAWSIRPQAQCVAELERLGVEAEPQLYTPVPVPAPVVVRGKVGGVIFRKTRHDADLILSCELASRLPRIAEVVSRYGVTIVDVLSALRREPEESFHTVGMGLDIVSFQTDRGELNVLDHWVEIRDVQTCYAPTPDDWRSRALLNIACDLANTHRLSTVITPNYRRGHEDHFHIDIRPDDPRIYVR